MTVEQAKEYNMMQTYRTQLQVVRMRMEQIKEISLEEKSFNSEWLELIKMEDCLIRLIKITKERNDGR